MTKSSTELLNWMKENQIDTLICQSRANVYYLTGFDTDPHERLVAIFLFENGDEFFVCPNMEVNQVKHIYSGGDIIGYSDTDNVWQLIKEEFNKRNIPMKKVAVEKSLSWDRMKEIQQFNGDVELFEVDEAILNQRIIKSEEEVVHLKEAAKLADYGVKVGVRALKEGITEMEVLATIEYELKKKGIREMSFSTMVLFGEKAGDPHGNPGNRKLKKGDAVLFDLGVVCNGYCSDITRTVFFDHVKEEDQEVYEVVLSAQEASISLCSPGNKISQLDAAARQKIADHGFAEYFPHRIGHGLGIEVHEYPSLNATNNSVLKAGMTFTIEPGIYVPNKVGVRIEDDVLITNDGHELLTKFPRALTIVPCT
ncbi:M24 family metallopeptidase [Evansella cellulosilytica]|uniref:Peptidase M24 n=1 Tax=Evansella cellulosilytica (strain ATCC 21833 / DSM 2522 / FERM P-1141 / JCM 9156 / N-4) TaxID=649639 RepID=E6U133_EVAC2|nr:Xaa-Pro peptidase family protein [Evansella cellulosilytica]ADU31479.1 peptidase M24 [Evansella cellulosilytica DSM 2522]